jgi:hypothetical protein
MRARFVTIAVAWSGLAHAEIPMYPTEITDRPIVLLPGMTELDIDFEFRTHVYTVIDAMGNATLRRTSFGEERTPAVAVAHAFGGIEVTGELGQGAFANVRLDLGIPVIVGAGASMGPLRADGGYSYAQNVSVSYKLFVAPRRFAVFTEAAVGLNERRDVYATGERLTGVELFANAFAQAEVQLTSQLGIYAGAGVGGPIAESSLDTQTTLGARTEVLFAFHRWDFYSDFELGNITRGHPSTFLSLGFAHRWGI